MPRSYISFDGVNRVMTVAPATTHISLPEIWSAWVDWRGAGDNDHHALAMRKSGFDLIPGGRTGAVFFLINQWILVVDFTVTRVRGVLFSDDFDTAYYNTALVAQYPAEVTSVVNTSTATQNIVVGDPESIALATSAMLAVPLSEAVKARKFLSNRAVISTDDRLVTIYDDDGTTILHQFDVSADKRVRVPV